MLTALFPILAYGHGYDPATAGCAITGGVFYNSTTLQFPSQYVGDYFFTDFCNGWIRSYDSESDTASAFATDVSRVGDLEVSRDGELYYLSRGSSGSPGSVSNIRYASNP